MYIFIFLHQTTTPRMPERGGRCVVYLYIPTSNHNNMMTWFVLLQLYIFIFLHQTTTPSTSRKQLTQLYIFIFLHQTTTRTPSGGEGGAVVYLYIPTSNHNCITREILINLLYIFIFLHQTTTTKFLRPLR